MIELEKTCLAKVLPNKLVDCPSKKIVDLYIENGSEHSDLRIRQSGDQFEITRKTPIEGDVSKQQEITIAINEAEFESFNNVRARKVVKTRYYYDHQGITAEFDVFEDALAGLVTIDFEFEDESEKDAFVMPEFCLADITEEKFIAGGMLAGKNFGAIVVELKRFDYQPLQLV